MHPNTTHAMDAQVLSQGNKNINGASFDIPSPPDHLSHNKEPEHDHKSHRFRLYKDKKHKCPEQKYPKAPEHPPIPEGVKLLRFHLHERNNEPLWDITNAIYDESGNVVYEVRGGGKDGPHILVDANGQEVASATGTMSQIILVVNTPTGPLSAEYNRKLLTARRHLTIGGTRYSSRHDTIHGKRAHSWMLDQAIEPIMTEDGSNFVNEWHMHFYPSCTEELERALIVVTLFERYATV